MKILVTGGTGMIGYSLQKLSHTHDFIFWGSKDCNLVNYSEVFEKLSELKPDIVIHLGANVGGLFKNMNQNIRMFEENLLMNINIVSISRQIGVKLVLSCLSTCIFPDKVTYPITEDQLHLGSPHFSNNGYAYSKRILDIYTQLINSSEDEKTLFVNFVPTNLYGENDNYHLENSHVIPALIHRAYLSKKSKENFEIKGTGSPLRMFIHSDDFAKIILDFIEFYQEDKMTKLKELISLSRENQKNYSFIIADSEDKEITIRDVTIKISQNFNISEDNLIFNSTYSDGQHRKPVSNQLLLSLYEKYQKTIQFSDFSEKLEEVCKYFSENYNSIRK